VTDQYGIGMGLRNSANIIMNTSISFGGSFFKKEENHFLVKVGNEEKKLLQVIVNMLYRDKSISPASVGETGAGMIPGFFSEKYAMMVGIGSWHGSSLLRMRRKNFVGV